MYVITYNEFNNTYWSMMDVIHEGVYDEDSYPYKSWFEKCGQNLGLQYNATLDTSTRGKTRIIFENEEDFLAFKLRFGA